MLMVCQCCTGLALLLFGSTLARKFCSSSPNFSTMVNVFSCHITPPFLMLLPQNHNFASIAFDIYRKLMFVTWLDVTVQPFLMRTYLRQSYLFLIAKRIA